VGVDALRADQIDRLIAIPGQHCAGHTPDIRNAVHGSMPSLCLSVSQRTFLKGGAIRRSSVVHGRRQIGLRAARRAGCMNVI
jgi:hypothetical protein